MSLINIFLICFIFIALIATAFLTWWIPHRERRAIMIDLGFSEFKFPGSYISNKIRRLLNAPIRKKNIYFLSAEGAQFLVIYFNPPSISRPIESFMIVVISEKLFLPKFNLISKLNVTKRLDSIIGETMDQLAELEASNKKLHKIKISNMPEFNKRFAIIGEKTQDVRKLFTANNSKKMLQIQDGFELSADSDLFRIKMDFNKYSNLSDADKIRKTLALARKFFRIYKN